MSDDQPEDSTDVQTDGQADAGENGECFVIAPIGGPNSETRKQTDGLLDEAIRPVVEDKIGLTVIAPHEIAEAGSITRQVIQRLLEAELVVADLTGLNANVMYELAVRHAKGEPVVPIAERGTSLPFDITTERTIFYEDSMHGLNELKPKLEDAARAALGDDEPDNPIYRAQQDFQMRETVAEDDKMQYLLDRLDDIESALSPSARPVKYLGSEKPSEDSWSDVVDYASDLRDSISRNKNIVKSFLLIGERMFFLEGNNEEFISFQRVLSDKISKSDVRSDDLHIQKSMKNDNKIHVIYSGPKGNNVEKLIEDAANESGLTLTNKQ